MSTIYFRNADETSHEEVSDLHPLPISIVSDIQGGRVIGRTFQISVGTSATIIAVPNPFRRSIKITNITGTQVCYLGFDNSVSSSTGDYLHSAAGSNTSTVAKQAIWGIAITGAQTVSVMEEVYEDNA